MTLNELINIGEQAAKACYNNGTYGEYYSGKAYQEWLALSTRYLEIKYPDDISTKEYSKEAKNADGNGNEYFHKLIGILKAMKEIEVIQEKSDSSKIIEQICTNFNKFDISIKRRHNQRSTIEINDEYDLQDTLHAILKLFINDIRPEDYVPSYAGGNSRLDFLLPEESIVIETKMTRESLKDKKLGEELLIDILRYKAQENCKHLICFIYDKDSYISNPHGLKKDLEEISDDGFKVSVFISPL